MAVRLKNIFCAARDLYTILYRETAEPEQGAYRACNGINKLRRLNARRSFKSHLRHHPLHSKQLLIPCLDLYTTPNDYLLIGLLCSPSTGAANLWQYESPPPVEPGRQGCLLRHFQAMAITVPQLPPMSYRPRELIA